MAYGRFRRRYRHRKRTKTSRRRVRRRVGYSRRTWRARYRRRRRGNKLSMTIFSKGMKPNRRKLKLAFQLPNDRMKIASQFQNKDFLRWGNLEDNGMFNVLYLSWALFQQFVKDTGIYETQYKEFWPVCNQYRWYRVSGVKIQYFPKHKITDIPLCPTYTAALSTPITGTIGTVTVPSLGRDNVEDNPQVDDAVGDTQALIDANTIANNLGATTMFYDPAARRSLGFAVPFLSRQSMPFDNNVDSTISPQKYYNSGYKRIIFNGGYQSIYYKYYRNTGESVLGATETSTQSSSQILIGWRPTLKSTATGKTNEFIYHDEQGLAVLTPLAYGQMLTRYNVVVTFYFKFLFNKGYIEQS